MSEPPRLFDSSAIVILQIFITMTWKQGHLFVDVMNVYDIFLDSVICSMLYVLGQDFEKNINGTSLLVK